MLGVLLCLGSHLTRNRCSEAFAVTTDHRSISSGMVAKIINSRQLQQRQKEKRLFASRLSRIPQPTHNYLFDTSKADIYLNWYIWDGLCKRCACITFLNFWWDWRWRWQMITLKRSQQHIISAKRFGCFGTSDRGQFDNNCNFLIIRAEIRLKRFLAYQSKRIWFDHNI